MEQLRTPLFIIGGITFLFTLIPLVRHDYWTFRIFDYPRFQKFILTAMVLVLFIPLSDFSRTPDLLFIFLLASTTIYLGCLIFPYTPLGSKQVRSASRNEADPQDLGVKILVANVYQPNRKVSALLKIINACDPDLLLLVETSDWWKEALHELQERYPEQVLHPLNNTYGLLFFSKFPLKEAGVRFLVEKDKPSIHATVTLPTGQDIRFFGIHPAPPAPQHNEYSTERDKELLIVGEIAKNAGLPTIVTGDLNDVAWSYTTRLFRKTSGLLDPRMGRGMFNTFHAKYVFFRWPLDHIFCSAHFKLLRLKKLPSFGSDHFPLFIELLLTKNGKKEQEEPKATPEEEEMAKEKIRKGNPST